MTELELDHHPVSCDSQVVVKTEDQSPSASRGNTVSAKEEVILLGGAAQAADSSPSSEASVSGVMAGLQITTPPHPEADEEKTSP